MTESGVASPIAEYALIVPCFSATKKRPSGENRTAVGWLSPDAMLTTARLPSREVGAAEALGAVATSTGPMRAAVATAALNALLHRPFARNRCSSSPLRGSATESGQLTTHPAGARWKDWLATASLTQA